MIVAPALHLPPLLSGHTLPTGSNPLSHCIAEARAGRLGAGDFVWTERPDTLSASLVLEPDVPAARCTEMLFVAMVAFGDALGALAPPEVAVTYSWPSLVRVNGAVAGRLDLILPEDAATESPPDWMVTGIEIALLPPSGAAGEPGLAPDRTDLWNEGCGDIAPHDLLESFARHLVATIHGWSEDGFGPVHTRWWGRLDATAPLAVPGEGQLDGLDEHGNALWRDGGGPMQLHLTRTALEALRDRPTA